MEMATIALRERLRSTQQSVAEQRASMLATAEQALQSFSREAAFCDDLTPQLEGTLALARALPRSHAAEAAVRSLEREAGELAYLSAECAAWKPAVSTALARIAEELAAPPTWRRRTRSELEIRDESDDAGGHGDGEDGGGDEVAVLEAARKAAAEARRKLDEAKGELAEAAAIAMQAVWRRWCARQQSVREATKLAEAAAAAVERGDVDAERRARVLALRAAMLRSRDARPSVSLLTSAMLLPRLTERLLAVQRRVNSLNLQLIALSLHAGPRTNAEGGLAAAAAVAAAASAVAAAASATSSSLASAAPAAASAAAPPAAPPPTPLDGGGREGTPGNPPGNPPGYGVLRGSSFGRPRTPPDAQLGAQLGAGAQRNEASLADWGERVRVLEKALEEPPPPPATAPEMDPAVSIANGCACIANGSNGSSSSPTGPRAVHAFRTASQPVGQIEPLRWAASERLFTSQVAAGQAWESIREDERNGVREEEAAEAEEAAEEAGAAGRPPALRTAHLLTADLSLPLVTGPLTSSSAGAVGFGSGAASASPNGASPNGASANAPATKGGSPPGPPPSALARALPLPTPQPPPPTPYVAPSTVEALAHGNDFGRDDDDHQASAEPALPASSSDAAIIDAAAAIIRSSDAAAARLKALNAARLALNNTAPPATALPPSPLTAHLWLNAAPPGTVPPGTAPRGTAPAPHPAADMWWLSHFGVHAEAVPFERLRVAAELEMGALSSVDMQLLRLELSDDRGKLTRTALSRLLAGSIDNSDGHATVPLALRALLQSARAQLDKQVEVRMRQAATSRGGAKPPIKTTPETRRGRLEYPDHPTL